MFKAKIVDDEIVVEKVIGYVSDDGELILQECGLYQRHLGYVDGIMYDGAAYGSTQEKAVKALTDSLSEELAVKRAEVARLETLLSSAA